MKIERGHVINARFLDANLSRLTLALSHYNVPMDAIAFLGKAGKTTQSLYVLVGDETFLKRQVLRNLRQRVFGEEVSEQQISQYPGDKAEFADVFDELETVPFFESHRFVVVENADPFVTKYRGDLEKKITQLPKSGLLVLDVKTWTATTRLAKMVDTNTTIVCKSPPSYKFPAWCVEWTKLQYLKQMTQHAANSLIDHVGTDMGMLDQEILKLVIYIGQRARIEEEDVDRLIGNNRNESTWKIFDALAIGDVSTALKILQRLFDQGEEPMRMLGAFGMQLRRLAQAARLTTMGLTLGAAMERAGFPPFALKSAEQQMRHLGPQRLMQLYDQLLQINLDLRGNSPLSERTLFERFLLQLARKK